jgi:hypothetical protein
LKEENNRLRIDNEKPVENLTGPRDCSSLNWKNTR